MNLNAHLEELQKKHNALSMQVEADQRSPGTDDLAIAEMKKEKLRIKEEMEKVRAQL